MAKVRITPAHRPFEELFPMDERSKKVWRYIDLHKFASMLEQRSLRFSNANQLRSDDPFEGAIPESWIKWGEAETRALEEEGAPPIVGEYNATRAACKKEGPWVFVNCWHMSEHESLAMWNLYAKGNASVCIQSTYGRLRDSLQESPQVHAGKVVYIDHRKGEFAPGSVFAPYMHKRHAFSHERELRVVWFDQTKALKEKEPPDSHSELADLQKLIEKVVVRPSREKWIQTMSIEIVEAIRTRYGLKFPVEVSEIDLEPNYP